MCTSISVNRCSYRCGVLKTYTPRVVQQCLSSRTLFHPYRFMSSSISISSCDAWSIFAGRCVSWELSVVGGSTSRLIALMAALLHSTPTRKASLAARSRLSSVDSRRKYTTSRLSPTPSPVSFRSFPRSRWVGVAVWSMVTTLFSILLMVHHQESGGPLSLGSSGETSNPFSWAAACTRVANLLSRLAYT